MHDIDRTQLEYSPELAQPQAEQYEFGQQEWAPEAEGEAFGETYGETFGETTGETYGEFEGRASGPTLLGEAEEAELAGELLEIQSEAELDRFLGKLLGRAARAARKALRSPVAQAVGGVLKGAISKAVPLAGGALGAMVGGPLGAQIGSGVAAAAGDALGLEGETPEMEDREFEGAKQFVRMAADTVQQAAGAPPQADPRAVAQSAAVSAARQHAPGLLGAGARAGGARRRRQSGGWMRHGNRIVLYGV